MNWLLSIELNYGGESYQVYLTMSEQSILTSLRTGYNALQTQIQALMTAGSGKAPTGAVEDAMVLIRCMTNNRLEEYQGKNLRIAKLKGKR